MEILPDHGTGVGASPTPQAAPRRRRRRAAVRYVDDESILRVIRRIAAAAGQQSLSVTTYSTHVSASEPSAITVIRRFGTWKNACEAAGLTPNPNSKEHESRVDDDAVFAAVRRASEQFAVVTGRAPKRLTQEFYLQWRDDQDDDTILAISSLTNRYGPWSSIKARALAGEVRENSRKQSPAPRNRSRQK